jgi:hypothetical protein
VEGLTKKKRRWRKEESGLISFRVVVVTVSFDENSGELGRAQGDDREFVEVAASSGLHRGKP